MSSKTEKYIKREEEFIFTTTLDDGLVLRTGNGVHFVDLDDREYIDATSQISLLDLGYKPKEVVRFITEQMQSGVHSCISADWAFVNKTSDGIEISRAALAEKLIKISDRVMPYPNKRVIFEVSGATAVNAAARIAAITNLRQKGKWNTQKLGELFLHRNIFIPSHHDPFRFSLLGFKNAFHGRHGEAKLLTDSRAVHYWGPSSSCAVGRLDLPTGDTNMGFYLNDVACLIEERLSNYAPVVAFFFEPIQGEGGINIPDAEGLRQLVDYLRSRGIYIIADEIQSGLGRTGKMFACEHFGIQPDMIILSKSLGAGLPIGAVIADADKFPDLEPGMHSGSMHCSPLSCAAALANLPLLEKHCFSSLKRGKYALSRFEEMKTKFPDIISDVRGKGLFIGIEFFETLERDKIRKITRTVYKKRGLLLAPCGEKTIRFCPPININLTDLGEALYIFELALKSL